MGLFKKNVKPQAMKNMPPRLPEIPRLPDLPDMDSDTNEMTLPQLPSFPNNSLGDKFSQNTIKEAVAGKKEVNRGAADEFEDDGEDQMMQTPLKKMSKEYDEDEEPEEYGAPLPKKRVEVSRGFQSRMASKKAEPVFIRLDKFEESMEIFEKARDQISEIEKLIRETKSVREKEEEELVAWENEIQTIKNEIEKVDRDIFSRIE